MVDESTADLDDWRRQIDALDERLVDLLNQRARCVLEVAEVKNATAGDDPVVYYRPEREAQVLRRAISRSQGPLPNATLARLYREIVSACMGLEQRLRIAYPGDVDGAALAAVRRQFGHAPLAEPQTSLIEAIRAVSAASADYALVEVVALLERLEIDASHRAPLLDTLTAIGCVGTLGNDAYFVVLGRDPVPPSGDDRTALIVHADRARLDGEIARSSGGRFAWVEVAGHRYDSALSHRLDALSDVHVIGSFPTAPPIA